MASSAVYMFIPVDDRLDNSTHKHMCVFVSAEPTCCGHNISLMFQAELPLLIQILCYPVFILLL